MLIFRTPLIGLYIHTLSQSHSFFFGGGEVPSSLNKINIDLIL